MTQVVLPKEEEERQKTRILLKLLYDQPPTKKDIESLPIAVVRRHWKRLEPLREAVASKAGRGKNNKHNRVLNVMALFEKKADMEV